MFLFSWQFRLEMLGIVMVVVILMGMTVGASAGFEASTLEETQFEYDDGTVISPDGRVDVSIDETADNDIEAALNSVTKSILNIAMMFWMTAADVTATWTYNNSWMPQTVVSGFLRIASVVPLVWAGFRTLTTVTEVRTA